MEKMERWEERGKKKNGVNVWKDEGKEKSGFTDEWILSPLHSNVSPIPSPPPASGLRGRERAASNKLRRLF